MPFQIKHWPFFSERKESKRAFSAAYDRYVSLIYTLAVRLVDDEQKAREVVGEVFKIIWENDFRQATSQEVSLSRLVALTRRIASQPLKHPIEQNAELKPAQALELLLLQGMSADEIAQQFQLGGEGVQHLIASALQEVRKSKD